MCEGCGQPAHYVIQVQHSAAVISSRFLRFFQEKHLLVLKVCYFSFCLDGKHTKNIRNSAGSRQGVTLKPKAPLSELLICSASFFGVQGPLGSAKVRYFTRPTQWLRPGDKCEAGTAMRLKNDETCFKS